MTYEELFRNAESHIGASVYFRGEIIQVLGEPGNWEYRINVTPTSLRLHGYGSTSRTAGWTDSSRTMSSTSSVLHWVRTLRKRDGRRHHCPVAGRRRSRHEAGPLAPAWRTVRLGRHEYPSSPSEPDSVEARRFARSNAQGSPPGLVHCRHRLRPPPLEGRSVCCRMLRRVRSALSVSAEVRVSDELRHPGRTIASAPGLCPQDGYAQELCGTNALISDHAA